MVAGYLKQVDGVHGGHREVCHLSVVRASIAELVVELVARDTEQTYCYGASCSYFSLRGLIRSCFGSFM